MIKYILILTLSLPCFAKITAMVRVLEAPIFEEPDELSRIVQYARKGDIIYLHPSVGKNKKYDLLRPEPVTDKELLARSKDDYNREYPDPMFKEDYYNYDDQDLYIMTLTDRKRPGYILKKHIAIQYDDSRELLEEKMVYDPTDYRINEPLPEGYPIQKISGYKGMFSFGMGSTTRSSYDYPTTKVNDENKSLMEMQFTWSKLVNLTELKRLYFGWIASMTSTEKIVNFASSQATENWMQLGIGPYISYDVWRSLTHTITSYVGFTYNFKNTVEIEQSNSTAQFDGTGFTAKTGIYAKKRNALGEKVDLALGLNFNIEPPTKMSGSVDNSGGIWSGSDFTTKLLIDMTLFIGIQSDY